jgi:hypothetical protein
LETFKTGDVVYYGCGFPNGQVYITKIDGGVHYYYNPQTAEIQSCGKECLAFIKRDLQVGDFAWWGDRQCKIIMLGQDISSVTILSTTENVPVRTADLKRTQKSAIVEPVVKEEKMAEPAAMYNVSIDKVSVDFLQSTVKKVLDTEADVYITKLKKELQPTVIKIDGKEIKVEKNKHYMFKETLYKCMVHKQAFLAGPTGSGKTTLAGQIAEAMGVPFYFISCTAGMSEAHLLGRMLFNGDYASSDLVKAYEEGGIFLFDEIDAADNNTLLVINSALANNKLSVPNRKDKPHADRHPNFICIVAGNSWGEGSIEYQGRAPLDRAFLDRFAMSKLNIDYDADLEKLIVSKQPQVAKAFHSFRGYLNSKSIFKPVSTRSIISAYKEAENGKTLKTIFENFIIGWSKDETVKAQAFISTLT